MPTSFLSYAIEKCLAADTSGNVHLTQGRSGIYSSGSRETCSGIAPLLIATIFLLCQGQPLLWPSAQTASYWRLHSKQPSQCLVSRLKHENCISPKSNLTRLEHSSKHQFTDWNNHLLAVNSEGSYLCSGDHTVKITCCKNGACLKVLREHERTPWAVTCCAEPVDKAVTISHKTGLSHVPGAEFA